MKRHTVEQIIDVPHVQILDVPVPQMGDQLVEFMQRLDTATPVQVIAVPKISMDRITQRFVDRRPPQRAEQLVEVPTDPAYSLLVIASSVLGGEHRLQGFHPEQSSTAPQFAEQIFEIPVPRGYLQGSRPGHSVHSLHRTVEQIVGHSSSAWLSGGWWRSSRFSPETGFFSFILIAWCLG